MIRLIRNLATVFVLTPKFMQSISGLIDIPIWEENAPAEDEFGFSTVIDGSMLNRGNIRTSDLKYPYITN